jgi:hypothetical protein
MVSDAASWAIARRRRWSFSTAEVVIASTVGSGTGACIA